MIESFIIFLLYNCFCCYRFEVEKDVSPYYIKGWIDILITSIFVELFMRKSSFVCNFLMIVQSLVEISKTHYMTTPC